MPFDLGPSGSMLQQRFGQQRPMAMGSAQMGVRPPESPRPMNPGMSGPIGVRPPEQPQPMMANPGNNMATGNMIPPPRVMPPGMGGSMMGRWHPQNNTGVAGGNGYGGGGPNLNGPGPLFSRYNQLQGMVDPNQGMMPGRQSIY